MNERIHQQIAESAAHVRELDERDKELSSEIEERQAEKARVALERDREVYAIKKLESALDDQDREKSWSAQHRYRREGDPLSVPVLMQQVLEKHPNGLQVPALYAEVRKLGFQSESKKPMGVLASTLHARSDLFARRKVARGVLWFLKKYEHVLPAENTASRFEKIVLKDKAQVIASMATLVPRKVIS
jgi:hypothetical protein